MDQATPDPARHYRVLVLNGSPHKAGATYTASRKFLEVLGAYGDVDGEILNLADYDIRTCKGCKLCFMKGEEFCPLKDDRDAILSKMAEADGVVFASPNYSWNVSGVMKVFLDRLGFAIHRPRFHGKTASAIVVQGMFRGDTIRKYLEFVAGSLGFHVVRGSVSRTLEPMTEKAQSRRDADLAKLALRFHERLLKPPYPVPSMLELMMFRMGRTGIRLNAPREGRDLSYYREQGWLESDFYYPVKLGPVKRMFGRLFDWMGARGPMFKVAEKPVDPEGEEDCR